MRQFVAYLQLGCLNFFYVGLLCIVLAVEFWHIGPWIWEAMVPGAQPGLGQIIAGCLCVGANALLGSLAFALQALVMDWVLPGCFIYRIFEAFGDEY